ncbi:GUN4 domain protein [Hyella patelloides LEGE 07179]|uniref:GUN4 domain protein n=1 Tax=Hyella patelloides LEGE 07179 TaxID=945734 RepID=A0A563VL04_9CYAN|nr:GUN4 domain-containing protein [Hyella patelloides]VEP12130.1 GUN4 domain protein [Hyella patelloides LEGE 07179]
MTIDFLSLQLLSSARKPRYLLLFPITLLKKSIKLLENTSLKVSIALAIPLYLLGVTTTLATPILNAKKIELVQNLAPQEISSKAKQFTVRIDGAGIGTGVIIDESETTYTVLTNWHVVKQSGEYSIKTIDGKEYPVNYDTVRELPNLDLAILQFERTQNYQLARVGNSSSLVEGQNVYFAGYPGQLRTEDNRHYRFFPANLVGILPESTDKGYSLIYNGEAFPGMSGGPVLDSQGLLIGIHGETNVHAITGGTSNYAIPIALYQASISQIASSSNQNNSQPNQGGDEETSATASPENSSNPPATIDNTTPDRSVAAETPPENTPDETESSSETESSDQKEPTANSESTDSTLGNNTPLNSPSPSNNEEQNDSPNIVSVPTLTAPSNNPTKKPSVSRPPLVPQKNPELLSRITGINYTNLKESLAKKEWEQADRQTQQLITRIIETAKRQNNRSFITINAIADYACQDISTIDSLWQQYSNNKFGFAAQQNIWQNNQENNDFSPDSWRIFATEIGWKEGDISNSGGYLLYEQLTFDPKTAPQGHLPWWFAASEEQQNIIKSILNRCSLVEVREVQEAENGASSETPEAENTPEEENEAPSETPEVENTPEEENGASSETPKIENTPESE